MNNQAKQYLPILVAAFFGLVVGLAAQSRTTEQLTKLSSESANPSKMDIILLNTRINLLQQSLQGDISAPFVPTSLTYDTEGRKIRISVHVEATVPGKMNLGQLTKALEHHAENICIAPSLADGNIQYLLQLGKPKDYCTIRFFTYDLDSTGHVQPRDIAAYEDGRLSLK
jgi:hypothetical protein